AGGPRPTGSGSGCGSAPAGPSWPGGGPRAGYGCRPDPDPRAERGAARATRTAGAGGPPFAHGDPPGLVRGKAPGRSTGGTVRDAGAGPGSRGVRGRAKDRWGGAAQPGAAGAEGGVAADP